MPPLGKNSEINPAQHHKILQNVTGFYRETDKMTQIFTEENTTSQNFTNVTGFYRETDKMTQDFTEEHKTSQDSTECHRILQRIRLDDTEFYRRTYNSQRFYRMSQDSTEEQTR